MTFDEEIEFFSWPLPPAPGGQQIARTETGVLAVHRPTGIAIAHTAERSRHANKITAVNRLRCLIDLYRYTSPEDPSAAITTEVLWDVVDRVVRQLEWENEGPLKFTPTTLNLIGQRLHSKFGDVLIEVGRGRPGTRELTVRVGDTEIVW